MSTENEKPVVLYSGKSVPATSPDRAQKSLLTRSELRTIHLMPTADPICFTKNEDGSLNFYFSPDNVTVTPAEVWYSDESEEHETLFTLPDGSLIPLMDKDSSETLGLYTIKHLHDLHLTVVEAPCAFFVTGEEDDEDIEDYENSNIFPYRDGNKVFLYDIRTCRRNPLLCVRCNKGDRFKNKMCRACYEKDMHKRRKVGDAYRASVKGVDRAKAIFFDLELTGVYPYDEIISVSITDGYGNELMNTLVHPERRKQWNVTVKIHGITPQMVASAPYLSELTPKIKAILLNADIIVAYGISTDYTHIKKIFTEKEQEKLKEKLRCCAKEYVRYISEYEPDINRSALISAMEYFKIEWTGSAHTSMADTHACRFVWDKLFPACYTEVEDPSTVTDGKTELMALLDSMPSTRTLSFEEGAELAKKAALNNQKQKQKKNTSKQAQNNRTQKKQPSEAQRKQEEIHKNCPKKNKAEAPQNKTPERTAEKPSERAAETKKKSFFLAGFFKPKKTTKTAQQHHE